MNYHKLKSKVVQERERRSPTNYKARGRDWTQNVFGTFPAASSGRGSAGTSVPTLTSAVGSIPFHLRQNELFRGGEGESRAREQWGCEGFAEEGSWPCRSRLCPAHAVTRSTRGGSSRGLCSHWSLKSQTFHNVPSHCRKAEQGCECACCWELSKWKHWLPGKGLSDLTVTAWEIRNYYLLCAKLQLAEKVTCKFGGLEYQDFLQIPSI